MTTPTPEALARVIVKRFARGKPEDVDLSSHDWYVREITTALAERERAVWEAAAQEIPMTWLDPLLSAACTSRHNTAGWSTAEIEALLRAIRDRLRARAAQEKRDG